MEHYKHLFTSSERAFCFADDVGIIAGVLIQMENFSFDFYELIPRKALVWFGYEQLKLLGKCFIKF